MEFLLELLLEFFIEFFVSGSVDLAEDKTIPRRLRIAALSVATIFYLAFTVLFIILFVECGNVFARVLLGAVIMLFVWMLGRFWYRLYKKK